MIARFQVLKYDYENDPFVRTDCYGQWLNYKHFGDRKAENTWVIWEKVFLTK